MTITEHVSLKELTTFKIGGTARFFAVIKDTEELEEAVLYAQSNNLKILVLGGGSNVLISDNGFDGLVIKIEIVGIEILDRDNNKSELIAGAGENWDDVVAHAVSYNLYGLENLSLIPGSVGAAPVQNIGAYGVEADQTISWVEVFNTETQEVLTLSNSECEFGYRDSIFKKPEGKKYVITKVAFKLSKEHKLSTDYKDIAAYIEKNNLHKDTLTLKQLRDIVIDIRTNKLPDLKVYGTAGSFFKNPIITKERYEELKSQHSELPSFPYSETSVKVPAAWLLDKLCGFKGYREGKVGVYQNQALVLVNFGNGTAEQVNALADKMIACVELKTEIKLEKEVQIIF